MRHLVIGGRHIAPPSVIEFHITNLRKYALHPFRDARPDAPFPAKGHNQAAARHQPSIRIKAIEIKIALCVRKRMPLRQDGFAHIVGKHRCAHLVRPHRYNAVLQPRPEIPGIGVGRNDHAFGVQNPARRFHRPTARHLPDGAHRASGMHHRPRAHRCRCQAARIAQRIDPPAGLILPPAMPVIRTGEGGHFRAIHHAHRGAAAAPLFHARGYQLHA